MIACPECRREQPDDAIACEACGEVFTGAGGSGKGGSAGGSRTGEQGRFRSRTGS